MDKILISACLAGERARYDGKVITPIDPKIAQWIKEGRAVLFCPEMEGGLPVPRDPAEIEGEAGGEGVLMGKARVKTACGGDVTRSFVRGAEMALELCKREKITTAVLKERSPSCGSSCIYDGRFSGTLIKGQGVAAALLTQHGITVLSEDALNE